MDCSSKIDREIQTCKSGPPLWWNVEYNHRCNCKEVVIIRLIIVMLRTSTITFFLTYLHFSVEHFLLWFYSIFLKTLIGKAPQYLVILYLDNFRFLLKKCYLENSLVFRVYIKLVRLRYCNFTRWLIFGRNLLNENYFSNRLSSRTYLKGQL